MSVYLGKDKIDLAGGITVEGNGGVDTSDATALPSEIQQGKTAYVKGEKITGTIEHNPINFITSDIGYNSNSQAFYKNFKVSRRIIDINDVNTFSISAEPFGNATEADVRSGVTFTSRNGLSLTGTMQQSSGGTDTSDATATASDILYNKTAYVQGRKVWGTMQNIGHVSHEFDALKSDAYILPSGYISGGTITLSDSVETQLSQI